MDHLTSALAIKALDGLTARAAATAENIANANTPGYRPVRVSFEAALAAAAERGIADVRGVQPRLENVAGPEALSGVRLDLELATASTTALRYAAIIEVLSRREHLNSLATSGNV